MQVRSRLLFHSELKLSLEKMCSSHASYRTVRVGCLPSWCTTFCQYNLGTPLLSKIFQKYCRVFCKGLWLDLWVFRLRENESKESSGSRPLPKMLIIFLITLWLKEKIEKRNRTEMNLICRTSLFCSGNTGYLVEPPTAKHWVSQRYHEFLKHT